MMTFEQFLYAKFKSYSHGHEYHQIEVDGLWYDLRDYENALDKYEDYKFNFYLKGLKNEKGNELAGRKFLSNRSR